MADAAPALRRVDLIRCQERTGASARDVVAIEQPLEVRVNGESFSVIMRTPGADQDLALGFLFSEGLVRHAADVVGMAEADGIVDVTLQDSRSAVLGEFLASRRQVTTTSSCGMCGRRTLESLGVQAAPLAVEWTVDRDRIVALPDRLRDAQDVFHETGGLHGAGLFDRTGNRQAVAEDVGRHNAVDKVVGRMLVAEALPLTASMLCVSGRTSFEIVQKALLAGVPLVAAVSAPSSLAIEVADEGGITLLGFVRGEGFNIYTHPARVV